MRIKKIANGAATDSILLMMAHIVTSVLGIIVTKLLSVNFSLEEYGTYSQALLVTSTATSISILGMTNATNYFYNKTSDVHLQKAYIGTTFSFQYIVGTVIAIAIICFRGLIIQYFNNEKLNYILFAVAFTPLLTNLIAMYQTLFVSIGQAKKIAARNFIISVLRLLAVLFACFVNKNILTILVVILFLNIGQVMYFALMFKKEKFMIHLSDINFSLGPEILKFSIPMAVFVMTNALARDADKYVISAFLDTTTLAIYTNGAKVLPFDMLTASLITVLIPIITRFIHQKKLQDAENVFKVYLRIGYMLTFIFVGGAIAVARELMVFLYDEKYLAGLPVFIVYLIVDMIRFANITAILSGAGKTKTLMFVSIAMLVLNISFNILSYQLFGMIGPALTTLVLTFLMCWILLRCGAKIIDSSIKKLFNFKEIGLVAVEIVVCGFVANIGMQYLVVSGLSSFFVIAISYGGYLIVLFGLNWKRIVSCLKQLNQFK